MLTLADKPGFMSTLTPQHKSDVDRLWTEFWTGGITNPLTVIEQISFLMFARLLDAMETTGERRAERTRKPFKGRFRGPRDPRRWKNFKHEDAAGMLRVVRDEVFPHLRTLDGGTSLAGYMHDAQLRILSPRVLASAVHTIDRLQLTEGDAKGDLYEYLLSKLTIAGINGQFRTPRHIIRFMVELLEPGPTETIADPACGTAGFLVGAMQYLLERHTSASGRLEGEHGETIYTGDLLEPHRAHIQRAMFHGFDFDTTMLRIASMNLMLHGVDHPDIHYQDTLSSSFSEAFPRQASGGFDVVLANPPFKGSLDERDVHPALIQAVKTRKTELLFVALILRMLKTGGRSATIVPDGVLFGSSRAHVALRTMLVEHNRLEAVISLPSGVFKPYAGVSTAILVFRRGGRTDHVLFYDVAADGFSLDDRREPVRDNDLVDALARWRSRNPRKDTDRTAKHFMVPVKEIEAKGFDLSIHRYQEAKHEAIAYDPPQKILRELRRLEREIASDLSELEGML
jgi:type I restriction enzyme M protein